MELLGENEIHLWMVKLDCLTDQASQLICETVLSEEERRRSLRFCFDHHRQRFLATRGVIRSVLSRYCEDIDPADWGFSYGSHGKPSINTPSLAHPLHFNISHSNNRISIAVARHADIGVDVEFISAQRKIIAIAERYFSPPEIEALMHLAPEQQVSRFYALWTLKESYIKACGSGLIIPLRHFTFRFQQNGKINIEFASDLGEKSSDWHFWQFEEGENYRLALALKSALTGENYEITTRELLSFTADTTSGILLTGSSQKNLSCR